MYLDGAGICLTQHYTTPDRVEKLLALGGLSALGDKLSEDDPEPDAQDVCIAYHRDYGEEYEAPRRMEIRRRASGECARELLGGICVSVPRRGMGIRHPISSQGLALSYKNTSGGKIR